MEKLNKKTYAIIENCFGNLSILGYCNTEDNAIQICARHNEKFKPFYHYYKEMSFMENLNPVSIIYNHKVTFAKDKTGWKMRNEPDRCMFYSRNDKNAIKKSMIDYHYYNGRQVSSVIVATIASCTDDREKAEAKAKEMLFKFLLIEELTDKQVLEKSPEIFYCPLCKNTICCKDNYCSACGQKLRWEA